MSDYSVWRTLKAHTQIVNFVTFSTSGELLVTGDDGGNVLIWSLASGSLFQQLPRMNSSEAVSACWGDDKELFVGYGAGEVDYFAHNRYNNRFERVARVTVGGQMKHVAGLAMCGNRLAGCSGDSVVCWTVQETSLECDFRWKLEGVREIRSLHFLDRYTILATTIHEGKCILLDVLDRSKPLWRRSLPHRIGESSVSRNGRYLAVTNLASAVVLYEITPTGVTVLQEFSSPIHASNNYPMQTCFAESDSVVVAGSDNAEVRIWDLRRGEQVVLAHEQAPRSTLLEDRSGLVSMRDDGGAHLVQTVASYSSRTHYFIASACRYDDKSHTVRVWRKQIGDISGRKGSFTMVAKMTLLATVLALVSIGSRESVGWDAQANGCSMISSWLPFVRRAIREATTSIFPQESRSM